MPDPDLQIPRTVPKILIDFPGHFIKGKALSEKYDVNDLTFPLVVIDISQQAKKDPRYAVTVEDIKAYEAKYGPIPDGALVARAATHKRVAGYGCAVRHRRRG